MNTTMNAYDRGYAHGREVAYGRATTTDRKMSDVYWEGYNHGLEAGKNEQGYKWSEAKKVWVAKEGA